MSTEAERQRSRRPGHSARPESDCFPGSIDADANQHAAIAGLHAEDRTLLFGHSEPYLRSLGLPSHELAVDRIRASTEACALLGLQPDELRFSPLGPAWSGDLDTSAAEEPSILGDAGWLSADSFLQALGSEGRGRWLVRSRGRVIGQVDFAGCEPSSPPVADLLLKTLARARARARGRVELRDVLELRCLARSGRILPHTEITSAAGRLEAELAGDRDIPLELSSLDDRPEDGPNRVRQAMRRRARAVKRWVRPRPVVALSGVDGAGKSSLTAALQSDFRRMGLEPDVIWARPGMRMEWIEPILGSRSTRGTPTVAKVASGADVDASSRRGLVGWVWTMLVTGTFLSHVWWRHISSSGVKIYDRHLDDAIVTLDFVYAGVDLRVQRKLISWLLPRASITLYLSIDAATAVSRKPGDTFGQHAVESQLKHYADRLRNRPDVIVLDATRSPRDIAEHAFALIIERVR